MFHDVIYEKDIPKRKEMVIDTHEMSISIDLMSASAINEILTLVSIWFFFFLCLFMSTQATLPLSFTSSIIDNRPYWWSEYYHMDECSLWSPHSMFSTWVFQCFAHILLSLSLCPTLSRCLCWVCFECVCAPSNNTETFGKHDSTTCFP